MTVHTVEGVTVAARAAALETKSKRGREMAAGLSALKAAGVPARSASTLPPFALHLAFSDPISKPASLPFFSFHVAGVRGSTRASWLLPGCWLWPGCCACSHKDPSPLKGQAGAPGRGAGPAPSSQHRMQEREERIFSVSVPPGRDVPSSSGSRDRVRGFRLLCSLSARASQRAVLRGREDQRWEG